MLRRNATVSALDKSLRSVPTIAAGTTLLPSMTNSDSAAIVAQVVMTWLLAMRTALLFSPLHSGPSLRGRNSHEEVKHMT